MKSNEKLLNGGTPESILLMINRAALSFAFLLSQEAQENVLLLTR